MPMYYRYDCEDAYKAKNQYIFGGELIVCPITRPADKKLNLACVDVWLPKGRWTDIFTGNSYEGGKWVRMYRDIDTVPVLAPSGAIVPMYKNGSTNDISLDQPLEINLWRGNGEYVLYEDDGESIAYKKGMFATTKIEMTEQDGALCVTLTPFDPHGILPSEGKITLKFCDIDASDIELTLGKEPLSIEITDVRETKKKSRDEMKNAILTRVQGSNDWKCLCFNGEKMPEFVKNVLDEIDKMV
jgi:alpha-glucosidase (family GH31 glycosyl hydrolase)